MFKVKQKGSKRKKKEEREARGRRGDVRMPWQGPAGVGDPYDPKAKLV